MTIVGNTADHVFEGLRLRRAWFCIVEPTASSVVSGFDKNDKIGQMLKQ